MNGIYCFRIPQYSSIYWTENLRRSDCQFSAKNRAMNGGGKYGTVTNSVDSMRWMKQRAKKKLTRANW